MAKHNWTAADLPDMSRRTVVVTGASSGLGLVTARQLAAAGARVVLAVRDEAKGRGAAATMAGPTDVQQLDLSSLASVRAFEPFARCCPTSPTAWSPSLRRCTSGATSIERT